MANVPDTNTFSLQDVVNVVSPSMASMAPTDKYDLRDCFADAIPQYFSPEYEGDKDRLSNFRNYGGKAWFVYKPDRVIGIDEAPVPLDTAFSSVYGDETPDSIEFSYDRNICNDNLDVILLGGTGANIYLDNTQDVVIHPYEYTYSMRDSLNNVGYTGKKAGTWYWVFSGISEITKLRDYDIDFWGDVSGTPEDPDDLGSMAAFMKFEVVESITPTSFDLNGSSHTCNITTHVDGNFTLSKVGTIGWITITSGTGTDQDGATFTVDANTLSTNRSAQLKLSTDTNDFYIDIDQSYENISVSPSGYSVGAGSHIEYSIVTTEPDEGTWSVKSSPTWITATKDSTTQLKMVIASNSGDARIGYVIVRHNDDIDIVASVKITQEQGT